MAYKTLTKAIMIAGLALGVSAAASAADAKLMMGASTSMLANNCQGCHGTDGVSVGPASPTIAGLSKDYFIEVMEGFASGEVKATIMDRIAKGYTQEEIAQLADHYAGLPFVKAVQTFDSAQVKEGGKLHDKYCEKCHAEGGTSAEDDAGVLAGQWTQWVRWSIDDFQAGHREMPKKMKKQLEKMLSKEGTASIDALLNYYASQQK